MRYSCLICIFLLVFLNACSEKNAVEKEIVGIPMEVTVNRFDRVFDQASPADLPQLKREYPQFFPAQFPDSLWISRFQDTLQQQLHDAVNDVFTENSVLEDELTDLFKHIKYYFPQFEKPGIYTTTSDVDYKNRVILSDSLLIVALDCYLGADHPFYDGIPLYVGKNLTKSQLPVDVAATYSRQLVVRPSQRTFLAQMIYFGKELYLKDLWLPEASDARKIGYTEEEMVWAEDNEIDVWRYFIENEILYSTDVKLLPRFINPAPFSKFYLEIDNESPGMIGRYIGWQIVRAYMENNNISLVELMQADPQRIFNNSKYKPNK